MEKLRDEERMRGTEVRQYGQEENEQREATERK